MVWKAVVVLLAVAVVGLVFTTTKLRQAAQQAYDAKVQAHSSYIDAANPMAEASAATAAVPPTVSALVPVATHTTVVQGVAGGDGMVDETVQGRCCGLRARHNLVPTVSWGSLPVQLQQWWKDSNCDILSQECYTASDGVAGDTDGNLPHRRSDRGAMAVVDEGDTDCKRETGVAIDGGDIFAGYYNTETASECCRACNLRPDCHEWSYAAGMCWRKGRGGRHTRRRGTVSGSRCSRCGTVDEELGPCSNATKGTACFAAIETAMKLARSPASSLCAIRGFGLLPGDGVGAYQSYVSDTTSDCPPPCLPFAATAEQLTLSIEPSEAIPGRLLAVGVPSACRENSHLPYLGRRLAHHLNSTLGGKVRFVAWQSHNAAENAADRAKLESVGFTVTANVAGYPPFRVRKSLGDPAPRVRWRSNEALDYSRVLQLVYAERSKYVLVVQDDTFAAPDVGGHLERLLVELERRDPQWGMVSLYTDTLRPQTQGLFEQVRGPTNPLMYGRAGQAVALLFRREVVPGLCEFVSRNFMEAPVDWMLYSYIGHLHGGTGLKVYGYNPNLFQHVGWISTAKFNSKVQGRKFTSRTFSMSLAEVESALQSGKL